MAPCSSFSRQPLPCPSWRADRRPMLGCGNSWSIMQQFLSICAQGFVRFVIWGWRPFSQGVGSPMVSWTAHMATVASHGRTNGWCHSQRCLDSPSRGPVCFCRISRCFSKSWPQLGASPLHSRAKHPVSCGNFGSCTWSSVLNSRFRSFFNLAPTGPNRPSWSFVLVIHWNLCSPFLVNLEEKTLNFHRFSWTPNILGLVWLLWVIDCGRCWVLGCCWVGSLFSSGRTWIIYFWVTLGRRTTTLTYPSQRWICSRQPVRSRATKPVSVASSFWWSSSGERWTWWFWSPSAQSTWNKIRYAGQQSFGRQAWTRRGRGTEFSLQDSFDLVLHGKMKGHTKIHGHSRSKAICVGIEHAIQHRNYWMSQLRKKNIFKSTIGGWNEYRCSKALLLVSWRHCAYERNPPWSIPIWSKPWCLFVCFH